ncbi:MULTISPECIES: ABC transporter substrate-binding protein [Nitrincola]|uniref:PBP superfamily domain protein n=1 Tax=Nitrincola nitratireducens TaxID=1229521 RepID=W9US17_9GAMM|nr:MULTISPECIES: substrate-binding domain-containing protein [Nitrincola]EXJ09864.1 PBP superfamily domain protein [Nitrincola nitratireducens]
MIKRLIFGLLLISLFVNSGLSFADAQLRLATTTSTYNSGLLDFLLPEFEAKTGVQVHVISVGTGAALRLGQDGDVDLVMTHAPEAEAAFVAAGYGIEPKALMYNDFVIVGPLNDPSGLKEVNSAVDAFTQMVARDAMFISRGDDSGTHIKENEIWHAANITLPFAGYRAVGQGMGRVLSIADELQAYALTDRGTWLAMKSKLDLALVYEGDERLFNPYQVILVNPERHPHVKVDLARQLSDWLVSTEGQRLINAFQIEGEALFFASADSE